MALGKHITINISANMYQNMHAPWPPLQWISLDGHTAAGGPENRTLRWKCSVGFHCWWTFATAFWDSVLKCHGIVYPTWCHIYPNRQTNHPCPALWQSWRAGRSCRGHGKRAPFWKSCLQAYNQNSTDPSYSRIPGNPPVIQALWSIEMPLARCTLFLGGKTRLNPNQSIVATSHGRG